MPLRKTRAALLASQAQEEQEGGDEHPDDAHRRLTEQGEDDETQEPCPRTHAGLPAGVAGVAVADWTGWAAFWAIAMS